jgi:hypothetical protein
MYRLIAQSSKEEAELSPALAGGPPGDNGTGGSGGGGGGNEGSGSGGSSSPAGALLAGKAVESLPAGKCQ